MHPTGGRPGSTAGHPSIDVGSDPKSGGADEEPETSSHVESIEPALSFWEERLGFERTVEVPQGDRLGFLTLANGGVEVMYQTRASVAEDLPQLVDTPVGGTLLFIVVDDLDAIEVALDGIELVQDRRTTFYGATEIVVREPAGGNAVVFAEFAEDSEESD